jgi:hypothetical protein
MATASSIEVEHPSEFPGGLALLAVFDEGDQRDGIPAPIVRRKVRPHAGPQIDLETPQVAIAATGVKRQVLVALAPSVWEQAATDTLEAGDRRGVYGIEVDGMAAHETFPSIGEIAANC